MTPSGVPARPVSMRTVLSSPTSRYWHMNRSPRSDSMRWMPGSISIFLPSEHAVARPRLGERGAAGELAPHEIFLVHLLERGGDDLLLDAGRDDDDAVRLGEDEVARAHRDVAAADGEAVGVDRQTSHRVHGAGAGREDGEAHFIHLPPVAHQAVQDQPPRPACRGRGREQLPPEGGTAAVVGRSDHHIALPEAVDRLYLE